MSWGAWRRAQAWLSPPCLVLGPPVCGDTVWYSTLWCLYPIAMWTPQRATRGLEALSAWRVSYRPRLPRAFSLLKAQCTSAGLDGGMGPQTPSLLPLSSEARPQGRAHIMTSTPKYPEETTCALCSREDRLPSTAVLSLGFSFLGPFLQHLGASSLSGAGMTPSQG